MLITKFVAIDPDEGLNGRVKYRLLTENVREDEFTMDADSGELFTLKAQNLKQMEGKPMHQTTLRVEAVDQGQPPLSTRIFLHLYLEDKSANEEAFTVKFVLLPN